MQHEYTCHNWWLPSANIVVPGTSGNQPQVPPSPPEASNNHRSLCSSQQAASMMANLGLKWSPSQEAPEPTNLLAVFRSIRAPPNQLHRWHTPQVDLASNRAWLKWLLLHCLNINLTHLCANSSQGPTGTWGQYNPKKGHHWNTQLSWPWKQYQAPQHTYYMKALSFYILGRSATLPSLGEHREIVQMNKITGQNSRKRTKWNGDKHTTKYKVQNTG